MIPDEVHGLAVDGPASDVHLLHVGGSAQKRPEAVPVSGGDPACRRVVGHHAVENPQGRDVGEVRIGAEARRDRAPRKKRRGIDGVRPAEPA